MLWTFLKKRTHGVFAISVTAIHQLIKFGVNPKKILPFGYFIPRSKSLQGLPSLDNNISSINFKSILPLSITAAETTGPAKQPLPTSSTPAIIKLFSNINLKI